MIKRESPVKAFTGYVLLPEYLLPDQFLVWSQAVDEATRLRGEVDGQATIEQVFAINRAWETGICAIVQEWHLERIAEVAPGKFPVTPVKSANALRAWLIDSIVEIVNAEEDLPN
jgi:hypothetical protein